MTLRRPDAHKLLTRVPRSLYRLLRARAQDDGVSVNQEIVMLLAASLGVPPVDELDARLAVEVATLATPAQMFDEYNGGSSVGWIAHRFTMDEPVVRRTVETQLRQRLEQCIKAARTAPKRVHISLVTAPLAWKGR